MTSLKLSASVANVELATDGLFLTLGKIIPPLRVAVGLPVAAVVPLPPCGMALRLGRVVVAAETPPAVTLTVTVLLLLPLGADDDDDVDG